jgi:hypothetical protein
VCRIVAGDVQDPDLEQGPVGRRSDQHGQAVVHLYPAQGVADGVRDVVVADAVLLGWPT